jgi:DNA-binding response OmpR family regulator
MRVFYIDDDGDDCEFLKETLNGIDSEIQCIMYTNSKEGVQFLTNTELTFDLIMLDINMPLMNGKECLIEIKKHEALKHVPVVMCSTTLQTKEMKSYFELGAYDFIVKPASMEKYHNELQTIINSLTEPKRYYVKR